MLQNKLLITEVAKAIYIALYKGDFDTAGDNVKAKARVDARTIISAYICRQSKEEAAKRLATWLWVDQKKPHVPWADASDSVKKIMTRQAEAGYAAIRSFIKK